MKNRGCEKAVLHQEIRSCDKNFVSASFFLYEYRETTFEYRGVKRSPQDFYLFIRLIAYITAVLCCEKCTE